MSDINTVGDTDKALEIHKAFKKLVISKTKKVGPKGSPARLMAGAAAKLKAGWHLTQNRVWKPGVEEIRLPAEAGGVLVGTATQAFINNVDNVPLATATTPPAA